MPENLQTLDEIITLRQEYAEILSYPSYAAYKIERGMAKNVDNVKKLLEHAVPSMK